METIDLDDYLRRISARTGDQYDWCISSSFHLVIYKYVGGQRTETFAGPFKHVKNDTYSVVFEKSGVRVVFDFFV